ncbi:hypothetical protein U1Q18_023875 [Sarracenia purpurea var. burkii]
MSKYRDYISSMESKKKKLSTDLNAKKDELYTPVGLDISKGPAQVEVAPTNSNPTETRVALQRSLVP